MQQIEGKVAFITGGASGIGLGMAKVFAEAGMKVVIADVREDRLAEARDLFTRANRPVHAIHLDVSDREAVERAAREAERVFGEVQVLCNNAGVNIIMPIDQATYDDWDWVLGVNLGGVVNGLQTFVPRLKAQGRGGHIVNTSSIAGISVGPGTGIYSATKFAILGLTQALQYDLAPYGIGVSALCPGTVATNLHESERIRPARYARSEGPESKEQRVRSAELLGKVLPAGMDPVEVGRKVLAAIRRNDFYIFPHPEFKEEFREIFDEIIRAIPDETADPARLENEARRRQRKIDALRSAGRDLQ
jgi:NAD(P)-dependent dehydrogenase (short-subunit alcohol dehydrogenase family)